MVNSNLRQVRISLELCCHCLSCQDALKKDFANIVFFKMNENLVEGELAEKMYLVVSCNKTCWQYCIQCKTVMFDRSEVFLNLLDVIISQLHESFEFRPPCHVICE